MIEKMPSKNANGAENQQEELKKSVLERIDLIAQTLVDISNNIKKDKYTDLQLDKLGKDLNNLSGAIAKVYLKTP